MFFDQLENLPRYQGIHKNIDTAIEYLMTHDLSSLDLGRYDVDEDRVFFFLQENTLCQEQANSFEFHARYLDLHFLLAGHEMIQYGCQEKEVLEAYDEERDILFYTGAENEVELIMRPGNFAVFFPEDIHRPGCADGQSGKIRKIVVKVAVSEL